MSDMSDLRLCLFAALVLVDIYLLKLGKYLVA